MVRLCIEIPLELLEKLNRHRDFNNKPHSLNDIIVEMMLLGIFDTEECETNEPATRH